MSDNNLVIIPAYNEQIRITGVVENLRREEVEDILVIDDASDDETRDLVRALGVKLIEHPVNMGVGSGLRTGFEFAIIKDYKYVITVDGDGQMKASDAAKLCDVARKGHGFVYGCRNLNEPGVPRIRRCINTLADIFTACLSGKYVVDTQSGLRCISVKLLEKFNLKSRGHSISSELIAESIKNNVVPVAVKVDAIYTKESIKKGQKISNSLKVIGELLG